MNALASAVRGRPRTAGALYANANALIVSTAVTSAAGLGFWALAARWLPADAVGIGTALVSVLTLLANLATLGLRNGVVRFLPSAGTSARRLIAGCYAACISAAIVLSGAFLLGQPRWAGHLAFLRDNALTMGVFIASTVVWVLFVLQDDVLIGLRKSIWVPAENLAYSIAKIAVLPVLTVSATWAVLAATIVPAVVAILAVSVLLLRLTRSSELGSATGSRISVGQLVRFAAADQTAWLISACTAPVLTLIVLEVQGPQASAYYYMANMIGYSLYLITSNIGSALIAESVHDPVHAASHARRALVHSLRLVLPLAAAGVLVGPLVLRVFGDEYADHAGTALQLIILSALPQTIIGISISTARVRREMSTVVVTNLFLAVAIWGGSLMTLRWWGVTGVGLTILVAHTAAALGLVLAGRTGLVADGNPAGAGWSAVARLSHTVRHHRARREQRRLLPTVLGACGMTDSSAARTLKSDSDTIVTAVDGQTGEFVLKISTSAAADRNLERHVETVDNLRLRCDPGFAELLPRVLDRATVDGHMVVRETLLPGRTPESDPAAAAAAAITRLHMATARPLLVTPMLVEEWVDRPVAAVRDLDISGRYVDALDRVAGFLKEGLLEQTVIASCTHGDFWPGNVLVSGAPTMPVVTGIVDWENVMDPGLPDADPVHWYLSTRPADLGAAVCALLDDPGQLVRDFDEAGICLANPHVDPELVVVFTWLWHVANTRTRSTRNGPGRIWISRNVHPVLRRFSSTTLSAPGGRSARHS